MSDLSARLATRKPAHQDVRICLDMDLLSRRDHVQTARIADRAARIAELDKQIQDASITLRVESVDRHTYQQWLKDCPPRKDTDEPFNATTFFLHAVKNSATYVDAKGRAHEISDEEWAKIDASLTDGEYDRLAKAVIHVNRTVPGRDVSAA